MKELFFYIPWKTSCLIVEHCECSNQEKEMKSVFVGCVYLICAKKIIMLLLLYVNALWICISVSLKTNSEER